MLLVTGSAASSLRADRRLPNRYSNAKGGGGAAGRAKQSRPQITAKILVDSEPTPTTLLTAEDDAKFLGYSVSFAGDVNGDGIDDVIVGVPRKNLDSDHQEVGAAFVIFGREGELPDLDNLDAVDGTNGFAIYGRVLLDHVGFVVSNAGDINGDGLADVIVGAPRVDGSLVQDSGQAFVIFGSDSGFDAIVDVDSLDGSNGFVIQGNGVEDFLGSSVSYAGDVNGDGIDDVIIGAPSADSFGVTFFSGGGEAYVIYGSTSFPAVFFITELNGRNGFVLEAEGEFDSFGRTVASAGDVNNDGISDILVGATSAMNPEGARSGVTYVIYGSPNFDASFEVSSLDGTEGFKIYGTSEWEEFGHSLAPVGDVNGDNIDDFVVGCPLCRPEGGGYGSGMAFIFYGTDGPLGAETITANSMVFGEESFDSLGEDVSSAGDVNGDGLPDILIMSGRSVGAGKNAELHIIYGSTTSLPETILAQDVDGSNVGAEIQVFASDFNGKNDRIVSASFAGDVNHDGMTDIIIGLPNVEIGSAPGKGIVKVLLGNHVQF